MFLPIRYAGHGNFSLPADLLLIATYTVLIVRRSGDPGVVIFACTLLFVIGIVLFIRGFGLLKRRRLILDTPFSRIRSASIGMVEISGQAIGPYTMNAPITAHACYFYRTLIWELKKEGKNSQWVKVAGECRHLPFFVDDNTGRVMVDPRGADLDLHRDFQQEFCNSFFSTKEAAPPEVVAFLTRYGVSTNNRIKVEEFCIKPKTALFVLGTLGENPGIEVNERPIQEIERLGPVTHAFSLSLSTVVSTPSVENDIDARAFARRVSVLSEPGQSTQRQEVIQLSTESGSLKTADMTQQQKVAAALLKAGISNPAAWTAAGVSIPALGGPKVIADPSTYVNPAYIPGGNGGSGRSDPGAQGKSLNVPESNRPRSNGSVISNRSISTQGVSSPNSGQAERPRQVPSEDFVLRPPVVLRKGNNNPTFLISWRSQQEVASTLGWQCALMIWGGPAISLLSLYFMLNVLHLI
jgi:hypothetical protein